MSVFPIVWQDTVRNILNNGNVIKPRGETTKELLQQTIVIDMRLPVLTIPERKLSYKFMAAEAFWILTGDCRVETIVPYNSVMERFSDNGVTFFGAYGPRIMDQIQYVTTKLLEDPDTRQAGLTIWRENPPSTKDLPCTVAIFFNIRHGKLNCHVFMRSSDVWLGLPYDVFNFSMLSHLVCALVNEYQVFQVRPGDLHLTAASSHLYKQHFEMAEVCCTTGRVAKQYPTPTILYQSITELTTRLQKIRDTKPGDPLRWWECSGE